MPLYNPLLRALNTWEWCEYIFTALVVFSCMGEAIAQFGHEVRWRYLLGKISTIVLAVALAFELVCLIQVNRLFDLVMGGTDRLARDAAANANTANLTAVEAVTGATSALHTLIQQALGHGRR